MRLVSTKLIRGVVVQFLIVFFPIQATTFASIRTIWAVNDGEKVERDDLKNANKKHNSAWDGRKIKIFGARNEIVAFQVIVEAGSDGISQLSARLPSLRRQKGPDQITYLAPVPDPTDYVQRPIQLFTVNYMYVDKPSHADWVFKPGSPAEPADPIGWKPVQLVPENAKPGRGGFPLRVEPNQNQAIW
ncbi:MAG TPA: hypothetical protein VIV66_12035, partial [Pyrinomonadaceae bacterium]